MDLQKSIFILFIILGGYCIMYAYNAALGIYGEKVGTHGRNCMFIGPKFKVHELHIRGKDGGYGIHGCPIYKIL